ncbi:hypothetical protein HD554DRAFT_1174210 [Boletus coccyginus]|nr:hypothetical protein HD554DRAFT_1174210 [Boletus coccyginus]
MWFIRTCSNAGVGIRGACRPLPSGRRRGIHDGTRTMSLASGRHGTQALRSCHGRVDARRMFCMGKVLGNGRAPAGIQTRDFPSLAGPVHTADRERDSFIATWWLSVVSNMCGIECARANRAWDVRIASSMAKLNSRGHVAKPLLSKPRRGQYLLSTSHLGRNGATVHERVLRSSQWSWCWQSNSLQSPYETKMVTKEPNGRKEGYSR